MIYDRHSPYEMTSSKNLVSYTQQLSNSITQSMVNSFEKLDLKKEAENKLADQNK